MGDFAPSKEEADFHFMSFFKELPSSFQFHFEIMLANLESQANLFDFDLALILLVASERFCLLVAIFTPVEDSYHGRLGSRGDLG